MAEEYFTIMNGSSLKPGVVNGNACYRGDVTETDLQTMRLSAKTCSKVNSKALKSSGVELRSREAIKHRGNNTFLVATENSAHYSSGLHTRAPLCLTPSELCPDTWQHMDALLSSPLSVACPTCWSCQRLSYKPRPSRAMFTTESSSRSSTGNS